MHSAYVFFLWKHAFKLFCGVKFKILSNIWAVHHNPDVWKDPEVFKPERHLNEKGEFVKSNQIIPFSVGPRHCLGEQLARMEVFIFLVSHGSKIWISSRPKRVKVARDWWWLSRSCIHSVQVQCGCKRKIICKQFWKTRHFTITSYCLGRCLLILMDNYCCYDTIDNWYW